MDEIKELVYVLNQNQLTPSAKNGRLLERGSKIAQFYEGLKFGGIDNDDDAMRILYPEGKDTAAYRKLKSQLRDRLYEALLKFDEQQPGFSDYQKAYYECHKLWLTVKILTGQNANRAALFLASKLLRQVEKFEFTLLSLDLLSYMMIQCGIREGNPKRLAETTGAFEYQRKIYEAESRAEQVYVNLISNYVNSKAPKQEVYRQTLHAYHLIEADLDQYSSYKLHLYGSIIGLMQYTTINDYRGTLDFCREKTDFFTGKPFSAKAALQLLYYHELVCWIQLRNYEKGAVAAERCFSITDEGTFNWFKYQELYLQLCYYTQNYEQANIIVQKALKHPRFGFLPDSVKESWHLFYYYSQFISQVTGIEKKDDFKFRRRKMLNELQIFSRDKGGMNAAIIIIRMLFLILNKKENELLDEIEAIEQYCYRHLRGKSMARSATFIKMLLQIPLSSFSLPEIRRRTAGLYSEIVATPVDETGQVHEIEIIPFEDLWELVLQSFSMQERIEKVA